MSQLFPLPLYTFLKIAYKNGGVSIKGIRNLTPWLLKTILFEPLRWVELAYNPKIRRHTLAKDPIFILGFYRSGTSYMHELMTKDDRLGYHTNFQMVLPEVMLSGERILRPFFDFICRVFNIEDKVHRVRLSFRGPGEEDAGMTTLVNPRGAQWGYFFPKMALTHFQQYVLFENIPPSEKKAWEEDFVFLLKKISMANQNKQLVLKSPPNTARVKQLLSLYPNAKFILIHRNPYEVYTANKRFWEVTRQVYAVGGFGTIDVNGIIMDTYARTMDRYLSEKDLVPEGQLIEIAYADFIQKPMENMQKIYKTLQLGDFSYCESKMQRFVDAQKSFVRLQYELPETEGKTVTRKFEPYIRHWNYPFR